MNRQLRANLRKILAQLYSDEASIRRVCDDAGFRLSRIVFNSSAVNNWHAILTEAHNVNQVLAILEIAEAEDEYGANEELRSACAAYRRSLTPPVIDSGSAAIDQTAQQVQSVAPMSYQYDLFISYSHADRVWVWQVLLPRLEQANLRVCIDTRDFSIGVPLLTNIATAVEQSRHTLIILTPAWLESHWTEFESLLVATTDPAGHRAKLLPLMLIACELPLRIRSLVYCDFTQVDQQEQQFTRLLQQIQAMPPQSPPAEEYSPFVVGPPITHPRHFFGYERELRRLFNLLRRRPLQNAAIIGPLRGGKTSFLLYLRDITRLTPGQARLGQRTDWLPTPEQYRWIFVDFQDRRMSTQAGFLRYLLTSLDLPIPDPCNMDHFNEVISQNLRSPTIVLLDEIGVALQSYQEFDRAFWQNLRALATTQTRGNLAFVLAAHENPARLADDNNKSSPFFNIFGFTLTLGPLTDNEALDLIASSPLPFPDEDSAWILEQSARWPILLQALCRERLLALEDGETGDGWRAEGLRQMEPFRHLLDLH
ncbi:MAG: toll/interleukin-1 receptor domain-containing protein [Caldilineaceae bacterium]